MALRHHWLPGSSHISPTPTASLPVRPVCHLKRNAISKQFKSLAEFIVVLRIISGHNYLGEESVDGDDDDGCECVPESFGAEGVVNTLFLSDVSEKVDSQTLCEESHLIGQELSFGSKGVDGSDSLSLVSDRDDVSADVDGADVKCRSEKGECGQIPSPIGLLSPGRKYGMSAGDLPVDTGALKEEEIYNDLDLSDSELKVNSIPSIYVTEVSNYSQGKDVAGVFPDVSTRNKTERGKAASFIHCVCESDSYVNEYPQESDSRDFIAKAVEQEGDDFLSVPPRRTHCEADYETCKYKYSSYKGLGYLPPRYSDDKAFSCTKSRRDTFATAQVDFIRDISLKRRKIHPILDAEVDGDPISCEDGDDSMPEDGLVRDESSSESSLFRLDHEVTHDDQNIFLMTLLELVLWLCLGIYIIYSEQLSGHVEN